MLRSAGLTTTLVSLRLFHLCFRLGSRFDENIELIIKRHYQAEKFAWKLFDRFDFNCKIYNAFLSRRSYICVQSSTYIFNKMVKWVEFGQVIDRHLMRRRFETFGASRSRTK